MSTLHEHYENVRGQTLRLDSPGFDLTAPNSERVFHCRSRIQIDLNAAALFVDLYVPLCPELTTPELSALKMVTWTLEWMRMVQISSSYFGTDALNSSVCEFTGRVHLYTENDIPEAYSESLEEVGRKLGYAVNVRCPKYARAQANVVRPLAFISHDSRDKQYYAAPLAMELLSRNCPVWYDEYAISVGDNLRDKIELGLKQCKKCILLLTPNYLENNGWAKREYDAIYMREYVYREPENVILPVWIGVSKEQVYDYCPELLNRVAIIWPDEDMVENSVRDVAVRLHNAIGV